MFFFLLILNCIFSWIFIFLNHPLSLGCVLLIQTIIISLSSSFLYTNFWLSYILFLTMIGSMLVMFLYMTSVASDEKFNLINNLMNLILMVLLILTTYLWFDNFFSSLLNYNTITVSQSSMQIYYSMNKFYNWPNLIFLSFIMLFLLITLIAIVKIIDKYNGTLRQK